MKALIVYGTRYASTTEIAAEIGKVLKENGFEVDIKDSRQKDIDVEPYDLIITGSGIKIGSWTKETLKFLEKNKEKLSHKKIALFAVCGATRDDEKQYQEAQEKYLDNIQEKYLTKPPVAMGLFGGVIDPNAKYGIMDKLIMKMVKKDLENKGIDTTKPYDLRDWDEIRSWAMELASK
ncbi:MAG: flavodoxin domain-containing protein [Methanobacteriaceae archaeon]|nr:flavodoxin domain-containing protein [Methanobacteriaceae archaeon]